MSNRRDFLKFTAQAAGVIFTSCSLLEASPQAAAKSSKRRQVVVGGKRIRTIDIHAHCSVPEAPALIVSTSSDSARAGSAVQDLLMNAQSVAVRLQKMDQQGIDVEVLSINPYWYATERDVAERLIRIQNEKLAELCAVNSERFTGLATVAL